MNEEIKEVPKGVKRSLYADIAEIVCLLCAIVFAVIYTVVILPKQGGATDAQNAAGAVAQGFAMGLAKVVVIAVSFIFIMFFIAAAVVETVFLLLARKFAKKVFCANTGFSGYRGFLIASIAAAAFVLVAAVAYPCLFGVKALPFSLIALFAVICRAVSSAVNLQAWKEKRKEIPSE